MQTELISQFQPEPEALKGKSILITGAAGGLGSSIATSISALGGDLILLDNNERGLNAIHDELEASSGTQPGLYPLDLAGASVDDYALLAETITDVFGKLDGLIHCAANLGQITPVSAIDAKLWQKTFTVNLHGPVLLTQAVLPIMKASGNAKIIFTLDSKVRAYWGAYAISKAATVAMVQTLADELDADRNTDNTMYITCNGIDPGKMRTSIRSSAYPGEDPSTVPPPTEKTTAYLYLLCSDSKQVNGQCFTLSDQT